MASQGIGAFAVPDLIPFSLRHPCRDTRFMLIDYAAITHQGKVRKNNEDAYLVSAMDGEEPGVNALSRTPKVCKVGLLAAVADGMGGAAAGEVASREGLASIAVNLFGHWGRFPASEATEEGLFRALMGAAEEASAAVLRYSDTDRRIRGMGSTLTATVVWNGHLYLCQVGDSRAYLYRRPTLSQLTVDQTLVNEMITSGFITPEEAKTHPQRSMITQALGCPQPVKAALGRVALRRGDRLLICSDGLHGEISDDQILGILEQGYSARRSLELMLEAALEHGGRDNITALLLHLDDPAFPLPLAEETIQVIVPNLKAIDSNGRGVFARIGRIFSSQP
ncbi:MAG: serine/threonine-protein phosphatase [Holophaga sp.]|nr:serine/threonine-protein phosphatase [Holophaga sp.]